MSGTKVCVTCHERRPLDAFNKRDRGEDGLQSRCRPCSRLWYEANRLQHGQNVRRRNDRVRQEWTQRIAAHLAEHPCVDCGAADLRVLEFDHVDPDTKAGTVGRFVASSLPWWRIQAEMDKCVVRCSSCHQRRTMTDCGSWRVDAELQRQTEEAALAGARLAGLLLAP